MNCSPLSRFQRSSRRLRRGSLACVLLAASCGLAGCHLVEFSFEDAGCTIGHETRRSDYVPLPESEATTEHRGLFLADPFPGHESAAGTFAGELLDLLLSPGDRLFEGRTLLESEATAGGDPLWELGGFQIGLGFENEALERRDMPH